MSNNKKKNMKVVAEVVAENEAKRKNATKPNLDKPLPPLTAHQAAKEINKQLAIARAAVLEATELAKRAGCNGFVLGPYDYDWMDGKEYAKIEELQRLVDYGSLEGAMSEAGWRMSSIGC